MDTRIVFDPDLIGRRQRVWLLASSELDMMMKGHVRIDVPEAERRQFLEQECADDPETPERILGMIAAAVSKTHPGLDLLLAALVWRRLGSRISIGRRCAPEHWRRPSRRGLWSRRERSP